MNSRIAALATGILAVLIIIVVGGCGPWRGGEKGPDYEAMAPAARLLALETDGPQTPGAQEALVGLVRSDNRLHRAEAGQLLGSWAAMGEVGPAPAATTSDDPLVRSLAQATYIEQSPRGRGLIVIEGQVIEVSPAVLRALWDIGDPQGMADPTELILPLQARLQKCLDANPDEAVLAADVLARVGDAGARRVLIQLVESAEGAVLAKAARASVRDGMELGPTLLPLAFQNGVLARRAVMSALVHSPDPRLAEIPLKGLKDADEAVRRNAIRALGNLDGAAPVKELAARLNPPGPETLDVIRALGGIGRGAADVLRNYLRTKQENVDLESAALKAFARSANRDDIPWVSQRLRSPNKNIRVAALSVLGHVGNPEAQAAVMAATKDPEPAVRAWAAGALGLIGTVYGSRQLMVMLDDPSPMVSAAAAWGLGKAGYVDGVPTLKKVAKSERISGPPSMAGQTQGRPQLAAIEALGKIGGPVAVATLREALGSSAWQVRATAAQGLGVAGDKSPETIKALEKAMQDPINLVQAQAYLSLKALGRIFSPDEFRK